MGLLLKMQASSLPNKNKKCSCLNNYKHLQTSKNLTLDILVIFPGLLTYFLGFP